MGLIDKQDAIKALRDTFLGDTYEIDEVACKAIENLKPVDAIPVDFITGFIDSLQFRRVFGNEEERTVSYYGINALEALLDAYYDEVNKHEQNN